MSTSIPVGRGCQTPSRQQQRAAMREPKSAPALTHHLYLSDIWPALWDNARSSDFALAVWSADASAAHSPMEVVIVLRPTKLRMQTRSIGEASAIAHRCSRWNCLDPPRSLANASLDVECVLRSMWVRRARPNVCLTIPGRAHFCDKSRFMTGKFANLR
jgi:hypothetical protein